MTVLGRRNDPIAAPATAPGRGAVGIIRASGPDLREIARRLCGRVPEPRVATLLTLRDGGGAPIDTGLALYFPAPHSYTGEDVLELQVHGGPAVLRLLLARVLEVGRDAGMRAADPGEFTQRAWLNGKLDLAQAEAVADLIDATSEAAARGAARALGGELSRRATALADALRELRALVEATLDFPEEDIDFIRAAAVDQRVARLRADLDAVLDATRQGALLREGMHVVLAGQPNVGKSSLLNALAGAELAIVTDVPGTTRDRLGQDLLVDGVPLHVIDTAGLREADDVVERIGVERSWDAIAQADAVLFMHDLSRIDDPDYRAREAAIAAEIAAALPPRATLLQLWNKVDAVDAATLDARIADFAAALGLPCTGGPRLSARGGAGLDVLRGELLRACGWNAPPDGVVLARARHVQALQSCAGHLDAAAAMLRASDPPLDLLAEELRLGHRALMEIGGEVDADALLGDIFGRFCIGK